MLRQIAILVAALFAPLAGGCDSVTEPPDDTHLGTYALVSVNGLTLPAFLGFDQGEEIRVVNGEMTLNADMTATDRYLFRLGEGTDADEQTATDNGTFVRSGATITVNWASGAVETFAFKDTELTLQNPDFVALFRK